MLLVWTGLYWCRFWPREFLGVLDIDADFLERHFEFNKKHSIKGLIKGYSCSDTCLQFADGGRI